MVIRTLKISSSVAHGWSVEFVLGKTLVIDLATFTLNRRLYLFVSCCFTWLLSYMVFLNRLNSVLCRKNYLIIQQAQLNAMPSLCACNQKYL